ncbi:MAG: hypothetical protein V4619_02225 [Bacteroidota bacterium]
MTNDAMTNDQNGVTCGPGYPFIRLQALSAANAPMPTHGRYTLLSLTLAAHWGQ